MSSAAGKPALQQWHVTEPYLHLRCGLGEGPYYEAATNSLRFVDIKRQRIHVVNLDEGPGSVQTIQLDTPVTVTADIEGVDPRDRIVIGAKYGIAVLDRKTGTYEYVARFVGPDGQDNERLRSNDGAVDPHGRFWLGTMTDIGLDLQAEGSVFLFDGTRTAQSMRHPVTIPNSVGWSPDGRTLYFTHSTERTIFAFDYAPEDGSISNERVFYVHDGPGEPDGCRVDAEGNLWHAVYGESKVLKISPHGELVGEIKLPTHNITCTQFVGTELFITSAGMEKGEGPDEAVELSGALFRVDVGVRGLEPFLFKLGEVGTVGSS
ncbi:SMP-30/Gluconolaconase/LRE-like region-domain-containing protein [Whalleya microplaca]|nr:SMP-30/Gluconolaconase/LRE-like region-domain-containing protein [Whalleya microplaca]